MCGGFGRPELPLARERRVRSIQSELLQGLGQRLQSLAVIDRSKRVQVAGLKRAAKANVTVLAGFLPDSEAQWLIKRSAGVVLSHASDDMVVSASFFYAMSLGQRVYAVETPFLRWASGALSEELVVVAPHLEALCRRLASAAISGRPQGTEPTIQAHFGDDAVARQLATMFERLTLHVRAQESYSERKSLAVCSSQRGDEALRS